MGFFVYRATRSLKPSLNMQCIVDNVRTIIQQQNEYIHIPDLGPVLSKILKPSSIASQIKLSRGIKSSLS